MQASKGAKAIDEIDLDAPIFDPHAFRLNDEQAAIIATARGLGQTVFASRAAAYDRDAKFPTENYRDLHRAGLLGIAIPKRHGGLGADYQTYAIAAAEIGRYCGATALTWNMHVCSTLWSGPLADDLDMDAPIFTAFSAPRSRKAKRPPAAIHSTSRYQPRPPAYPWSATGIRSACAARYRAPCCLRMCSWRRMRH
jgi:hypothetical protein